MREVRFDARSFTDQPPMTTETIPAVETGAASIRVAQIGTIMGGGVASVIRVIMAVFTRDEHIRQALIVTHDNGSGLRKINLFLQGFCNVLRDLLLCRHDLYHVHFSTGASTFRKMMLVQLIKAFRKPVVGHAHGGKYEKFYAGLPPLLRKAVCRFIRQFDELIVLSPEWAEYFARIAPGSRIVVIPNAVEIAPFATNQRDGTKVHIVALGRMSVAKGTQILIEALSRLRAGRAQVHLDLVGDGNAEPFIDLASKLGVSDAVTFHGWRQGGPLESILESASAFALPSFAEGLPMSMLECMSRGLPVVVTPVGGVPSVVQDGVNGLIVPVGDAAAVANAFDRLACDPALRTRLGVAGRLTILSHFSSERFAQAMSAVYTSALANVQVVAAVHADHSNGRV